MFGLVSDGAGVGIRQEVKGDKEQVQRHEVSSSKGPVRRLQATVGPWRRHLIVPVVSLITWTQKSFSFQITQ